MEHCPRARRLVTNHQRFTFAVDKSGPSEIVSLRSHQQRAAEDRPQPEASRRRPLPEELVSIARARVMKLDAARAAVGESDPAFSHLKER